MTNFSTFRRMINVACGEPESNHVALSLGAHTPYTTHTTPHKLTQTLAITIAIPEHVS